MADRDTWAIETPEERAGRLMRMNDYANAVTWCAMAMDKLEKLTKKPKKPKKAAKAKEREEK